MSGKTYWTWMPWARWFIPFPILVRISKKRFGSHVWYQDDEYQLEARRRSPDEHDAFVESVEHELMDELRETTT